MKLIITFITAITLLISVDTVGQNIQTSTIEWNSTSTFDAENGVISDELTRVTSSSEQIVWYSNDNSVRREMVVTATFGSWTDVGANGSITFNVNSGSSSGIIQFWKADNEKKIRIHLISETETAIYELTVTNQ